MDFDRLRTLRELDLRATMAAVAEALRISPSAVSQQISRLEDELGARLIERRGRGVILTPAGKRLVAYADKLTAVLEEAKADIAALENKVGGELRIAAFPSVSALLIPRVITALARLHPGLNTVFHEFEPPQGLTALRAWQVDVALIDDFTIDQSVPAEGLEARHLFTDDLVVIVPSTHRLARRDRVTLAELQDETWALDSSSNFSEGVIKACGKAGFRPRINGHCDGFPVVAAFVEAGCSVSLVPAIRVRNHRGRYRTLKLEPPIHRTISVVFHAGARKYPAVAAFLEQISEAASSALGQGGDPMKRAEPTDRRARTTRPTRAPRTIP